MVGGEVVGPGVGLLISPTSLLRTHHTNPNIGADIALRALVLSLFLLPLPDNLTDLTRLQCLQPPRFFGVDSILLYHVHVQVRDRAVYFFDAERAFR